MAFAYTEKQTKVLQARNHNVLVSAAAGSGKTAVLVERIIRMISEGPHPLSIDRLLVVTFTKAAAGEMRERIGKAIEAKLLENPGNSHLQAQATLIHQAKITTIDSFCTYILRSSFTEIGLDPGFRQMDEAEARLLQASVMEELLNECFREDEEAFRSCVDAFCPGRDEKVLGELAMKLYSDTGAEPDQRAFLSDCAAAWDFPDEDALAKTPFFRDLMLEAARDLRLHLDELKTLLSFCDEPGGPYPYAEGIEKTIEQITGAFSKRGDEAELDQVLARLERESGWSDEAGTVFRKDAFVKLASGYRAEFPKLQAIRSANSDVDPEWKDIVKEGRDRVKKKMGETAARFFSAPLPVAASRMQKASGPVKTLVGLTLSFIDLLDAKKKEKNAIDFADLERLALQVLLTKDADGRYVPTKACEAYVAHYDEVMVDEYQDSNLVQELILSAVAGAHKGYRRRFMVGDVKQSIYRFRNARPELFIEKFATYKENDPDCERIDLDQNFRSRTEVLHSVNAVFRRIMRSEIGGVEYDEAASLKPGASYPPGDGYETELLLVEEKDDEEADPSGEKETDSTAEEIRQLNAARREALAVTQRIRELVGHLPVRDSETGQMRTLQNRDIVILMRSTRSRTDLYREIFAAQGIPLYVEMRTGYFSAKEIRDVLQLLALIDNPRQDIPAYSVMTGYFGGFSNDDMARITAEHREEELCDRVLHYEGDPGLASRCREFTAKIDRFRSMSRYLSIHELLEQIFYEEGYEDYCAALPGGEGRSANLRMLIERAKAFEKTEASGLYSFLQYIRRVHETDIDYGEASVLDANADVVRLMTIHNSKGLEYPVCFVAGLAGTFAYRRADLGGPVLVDTDEGIGADVTDRAYRSRTTTLKKEAVISKIHRDTLGEELRILYVAMTRAKEKLILVGSVKKAERELLRARQSAGRGERDAYTPLPAAAILGAPSYLSLILMAMDGLEDSFPIRREVIGVPSLLGKAVQDQEAMGARLTVLAEQEEGHGSIPDGALYDTLSRRFSFVYPYEYLQDLITKTTVTELKKAAHEDPYRMEETGEGAGDLFPEERIVPCIPRFVRKKEPEAGTAPVSLHGAERGTAIHRVCELIDYRRFRDPASVSAAQWESYVRELTAAGMVPDFWEPVLGPEVFLPFLRSDVCARMAAAQGKGMLRREQPFVYGISASRLGKPEAADETVLIQGIIDAFFMEETEEGMGIVVVDYKTDRVDQGQELVDRYQVQLEYYAEALSDLLGLPVREKIIYSFGLQEEIRLPERD